MELKHIEDNLFLFLCDFRERETPKKAGFSWHSLPCKRKKCKLCKAEVGKAWYTDGIETAKKLKKHADDQTLEILGETEAAKKKAEEYRKYVIEEMPIQEFMEGMKIENTKRN